MGCPTNFAYSIVRLPFYIYISHFHKTFIQIKDNRSQHFSTLMAKVGFILVVYVVAVVLLSTAVHGQGTRLGFYRATCPQVESIVRSTVQSHFRMDPSIAPGLLRMHSHDCFVRGCDASVLLAGPNSERTAVPNRTLKGFEVIDDAKSQLEDVCPGVVSCADILALAARDSVVLTGGRSWEVPTGRRDGRVSLVSEVKLPGFSDSIEVQKEKFRSVGLNTHDLVTLAGIYIYIYICMYVYICMYIYVNS
ncbi:hypothetical protein IC582_000268 [Cucumis melo]